MTHFRPEPSWQREQGAAHTDPLASIYNEGQWKLFKVSPLFNLQSDAVKLKQYSSRIRQAIVSTIASNTSCKYSVATNLEPYLKYSEDDPPGINITVNCSIQGTSKLAYTCLLLSWGVNTKLTNSTHLPYLLERGEQKIGAAVKSTLERIFDCNIHQFCFTQRQLLQFGFNFLDYDTSKESEQFTLLYKTPQVDHNDKLYFSFDIGDARIMWNGAKEEANGPSEWVSEAYVIIQNQIYNSVMLDVAAFELNEMRLPKGEVKSTGIIKMKNAEIVNCVFNLLNEICSQQIVKDTSYL